MAPQSISIPVKIREDLFFPIVRILKRIEGLEIGDIDLDAIGGRSTPITTTKVNGARPARGGLRNAMIAAMMQGPQSMSALARAADAAGFSPASVYDTMSKLKRDAVAVQDEHGDWRLGDKTQAEVDDLRAKRAKPVQEVAVVTPALPPPSPKPERTPALLVIVANLQKAKRPLHRAVIKDALIRNGFAGAGTDAHLSRAMGKSLVRRSKEPATYELTAKGAQFQVPKFAKE